MQNSKLTLTTFGFFLSIVWQPKEVFCGWLDVENAGPKHSRQGLLFYLMVYVRMDSIDM